MRLAGGVRVPPRILIVDDEGPILFAMQEYFTAHGYVVDCAREAGEAEAKLEAGSYSVVIADLRLTGSHQVEGLEIVERVRQRHPGTRVIVLTAYGSPELAREAKRRGADRFLHKPQPLSRVERIVSELVRSLHEDGDGTGQPPSSPI
jgi:DNA-binding NtrC family response regulator